MRRKGNNVFRSVFIKYLLRTGNSLISGQPHKNIKYALKRKKCFQKVFLLNDIKCGELFLDVQGDGKDYLMMFSGANVLHLKYKKISKQLNINCLLILYSDPLGARTQDPNIKSVVLYQLSQRIFAAVLSRKRLQNYA